MSFNKKSTGFIWIQVTLRWASTSLMSATLWSRTTTLTPSPVREPPASTWCRRSVSLPNVLKVTGCFDRWRSFPSSQVIPMLPRLLCEELCSLNPLIDRLTFSVIWTLTPEGRVRHTANQSFTLPSSWFCLTTFYPTLQILSEWFGRSVIRSCVKLSYDHAQSMIEAPEKMFSADELPPVDPEHPIDEIHRAVLNLHAIAKSLRSQRFSGGALRLDQVRSHRKVLGLW